MEINELLKPFTRNDYQRYNFDSFIQAKKFTFTVPSIHIAGTNGKGSTACYIASIYENSGYKVGKFTSPFLFKINEMIKVNEQSISDDDFVRIFNENKKQFEKYELSAFEIETFIALTYFMEQKCDIAIIECGMGGEIDATNIITPVLSIITSVSLEHTEFLGHTISEIAMQKAGIIKEEVPVLIDEFDEDAITTIHREANGKKAVVHYIKSHIESALTKEGYKLSYFPYGEIKLHSFAKYSVKDACFALEAVTILKDSFPFAEESISKALYEVQMPCRFEIVNESSMVILDGAHNPEAAKEVVEALFRFVGRPTHVVFSCFKDKNLGALLSHFGSIGNDLTLTTFPHPRARTQDEYFLFLGDYPYEEDALELIKKKMAEFPDHAILVTGSLAFVAYVKEKLFHV